MEQAEMLVEVPDQFPGHPLNAKDRLLQRNNTEARMTASLVRENPESYRFQIVLGKA
jgi:hypothetical protein